MKRTDTEEQQRQREAAKREEAKREQDLQRIEERAREEYNQRVLAQLRLYEEKKAVEEGRNERRKITK